MASSSGNYTSSGSPPPAAAHSGSDEDLMDQRKRKRMQSNRESARRSRLRKQKHLDELTAQIAHLRNDNHQILRTVNVTTQQYVNVEAENSVLRAQMMELTQRLQSLNEILNYINSSSAAPSMAAGGSCMFEADDFSDGFLNSQWSLMGMNQHPVEMFDF